MEEKIDGIKIPTTEKGLKYSWVRAEQDDGIFYETFDSIEDCIKDAHFCWRNRCGGYDDVNENGVDDTTGFTIDKPLISIGIVKPFYEKINLKPYIKKINNELTEAFEDAIYDEINGNFDDYYEKFKLRCSEDEYENKLRELIKDNFDIYPKTILDIFYLQYDLLADKWIKQ